MYAVVSLLVFAGCGTSGPEATLSDLPPDTAFADPERVQIRGYEDDAMEPFLTRDGRFLFFNNRNDPSVNTDLHVAERVDSLTFAYVGPLTGANTPALEGVPTMDRAGTVYFVSTRSYDATLSTIYQARFADGRVQDVRLAEGVSREQPGIVNFDIEVSADGETLYVVDARFRGGAPVEANLVLAERAGEAFERSPDSDSIFQNINTEALEYAAAISADGLELFFTRVASVTSGASPRIYRAVRGRLGDPFGRPQWVAAMEGFVEGPTVSPDDRAVYYHKREGGQFVIYRVTRLGDR